jgi:hypothetical protein
MSTLESGGDAMADATLSKMVDEMIEFARHLPSDEEISLELLILRGHLLIEKQLDELITAKLIKPEAYLGLRLRFAEKLKLTEAMYGEVGVCWRDIREINIIRNSLSHQLEDETVVPRVRKLLLRSTQPGQSADVGSLLELLTLALSEQHLSLIKVRFAATA